MNRSGRWSTTITIQDPDRREFWEGAIGTATLPIKSLIPVLCNFPGRPNSLAYLLDLDAITPEMKDKMAAALAAKFDLDTAAILADFRTGIAPILAESCRVQTTDPAVLLSMLM